MTVHPPHRPSDEEIRAAIRAHGWPIPTRPAVVALRRPEEPGAWNDLLGVLGDGMSFWIVGTTDPGLQPMRGTGSIRTNPRGVARVKPGFYRDAYYPGYHGGGGTNKKHPALRQASDKPLPVERFDADRERWVDSSAAVGPYNLHRASWKGNAAQVGDYSHGCLVALDRRQHWELLLTLGYPEHGPTPQEQATQRWDLYLVDWSAYLARTSGR